MGISIDTVPEDSVEQLTRNANNDTKDTTNENEMDDWEEWDGQSPFWTHCVAGSLAGVVEHAAIFPLDTVRTHIQVCAACLQRNISVTASTSTTASSSPSSSAATATTMFTSQSPALDGGKGSSILRGSASATASSSSLSSAQQRLPLGMIQTIRYLVNEPVLSTDAAVTGMAHHLPQPTTGFTSASSTGFTAATTTTTKQAAITVAGWSRLFRGIQAVLVGCVPAHALYFSSYEIVKAAFLNDDGRASTIGSSLAGAAAVTSHDVIMTPLDTVKQRLQIGHYVDARHAARSIYQNEGFVALYRSFPITLLSNIPYGMVMVTTHEACKQVLRDQMVDHRPQHQWQIVLLSSSMAGFVASAVTTPLDRIKTALQTQQLSPICGRRRQNCPLKNNSSMNHMHTINTTTATTTAGATSPTTTSLPRHLNWQQAAKTIWIEEGLLGFWRGILPRVLSHTPAVAISWTTYETAKHYLVALSS